MKLEKNDSISFRFHKKDRHTHGAVAAGTEEEEDGHRELISVDVSDLDDLCRPVQTRAGPCDLV